ncbi:hypothetical protein Goshw_015292 [Gossypium schwendimanii]|uniref:Uncharacterized protein n=1 Tax=Gossypium schwendimanii TaxID=34291 RepID=A0A7J9L3J1_GOSSC|nr:hypothetical protein [Gossypium schwendimanii]
MSGGLGSEGELLVLKTIIHNNVSSPFAAEARRLKHIHRSGNSHAHRLAKDTLDRGETFYPMVEELKHHSFASERRWPRNPD